MSAIQNYLFLATKGCEVERNRVAICGYLSGEDNLVRSAFEIMTRTLFAIVAFTSIAAVNPAHAQCGKASWYAMTSITASGERASPNSMTAAHRTLPMGTRIRVTNLRNGKSVVVRINDRGPYTGGRILDVTKVVATQLGFRDQGWTRVGISTKGHKYRRGRGCELAGRTASLAPLKVPTPKSRPVLSKVVAPTKKPAAHRGL